MFSSSDGVYKEEINAIDPHDIDRCTFSVEMTNHQSLVKYWDPKPGSLSPQVRDQFPQNLSHLSIFWVPVPYLHVKPKG